MTWIITIILWFCLLLPGSTWGAISCTQSTLQSAVNAASNGDTITCTTGTYSWGGGASQVRINGKAITLDGNGSTVTGTPTDESGSLYITGHATLNIVIKGFTFKSSTGSTWYPVVSIDGSSTATGTVRITGNTFDDSSPTGSAGKTMLETYFSNPTLLIDNNTFKTGGNNSAEPIHLKGDGQASWERADNFGGYVGITVIENNTFDPTYSSDAWGSYQHYDGARGIWRYNDFKKWNIDGHPNSWGHAYATRQVEVYHNSFLSTGRYADVKGGAWLIYNNTGNALTALHVPTLWCAANTNNQICYTTSLTNAACTQRPGFGYNYALSPVYIWGNTSNTVENDFDYSTTGGCSATGQVATNAVRLNTEYYVSTKPGYTERQNCPHPTIAGGGTCSASVAGRAGYTLGGGSTPGTPQGLGVKITGGTLR